MSEFKMPDSSVVRKIASGENKKVRSPRVVPLHDHALPYFETPFDEKTKSFKKKLLIIPYKVTKDHHPDNISVDYWWSHRSFDVHAQMGLDSETVICPRSFGKKCPICDHYWKMWHAGEKDSPLAKTLRNRKRDLYHVVDLEDDKDTLLLWDVATGNFTKELNETIITNEENPLYEAFFDPKNGAVLTVTFIVDTFNKNKFVKTKHIEFTPRKKDYSHFLEQTLHLDDMVTVLSTAELMSLLEETMSVVEGNDTKERQETQEKQKKENPLSRFDLDPDDLPPFDVGKKNEDDDVDVEEPKHAEPRHAEPKPSEAKKASAYDIDLDDLSDADY